MVGVLEQILCSRTPTSYTTDINYNSINISTKINFLSPIISSIFILSLLNLQLNIDFNPSINFQVILSRPLVAMQYDDEIAIVQQFGNRLIS